MIADFARLLDRLIITRSRNEKLALIARYLREADPGDRGWALAALGGSLDLPQLTSSVVRKMAAERVDEELLRLSREFVGDTAETVALIWPAMEAGEPGPALTLRGVIEALKTARKGDAPGLLARWLDRSTAEERFALLKLALGNFRIGISERLAKTAFAEAFGVSLADVEEYWHASPAPHEDLFAWATGAAPAPDVSAVVRFRPFMLSVPVEGTPPDLTEFAAEWKWDGIRVQLARAGGEARLYSRGGEDITGSFPEFAGALPEGSAVDGELLVADEAAPYRTAPFSELQKRLGRKAPPRSLLEASPAFIRVYDLLEHEGADLRPLGWTERRSILERFASMLPPERFDLSPVIDVGDAAALERLRREPPAPAIEGVMLKRRDSPYTAGRMSGLWYKWKRDPYTADCVLMYAQRGSGKRSSFYSDYTFGCWTDDKQLVPVGKAYSGFTDEELVRLDKFVRGNITARFGPVLEVRKALVFEVAFDSIGESTRHKSGVAMRFPRISRIRWDKPAEEADTVANLRQLMQQVPPVAG